MYDNFVFQRERERELDLVERNLRGKQEKISKFFENGRWIELAHDSVQLKALVRAALKVLVLHPES